MEKNYLYGETASNSSYQIRTAKRFVSYINKLRYSTINQIHNKIVLKGMLERKSSEKYFPKLHQSIGRYFPKLHICKFSHENQSGGSLVSQDNSKGK